jgi:hypothetical protein
LVEVTWLGLLLLIPLVYVIVTVVSVQRAAYGATEAARAAGRAYVLSPDVSTAEQRAVSAATLAMADQGVQLDPHDVVIECDPTSHSCLQPGSTVEIRIVLDVSLPLMPSLGDRPAASISISATHVEPYGVYREAGG